MTTDAFTAAERYIRDRAEKYADETAVTGGDATQREIGFIAGWKAARDHLARQEATDAEVEAARLAIHQALAPDWMAVVNVLGADQAEYDSLLDSLARAALTAAKEARHG